MELVDQGMLRQIRQAPAIPCQPRRRRNLARPPCCSSAATVATNDI